MAAVTSELAGGPLSTASVDAVETINTSPSATFEILLLMTLVLFYVASAMEPGSYLKGAQVHSERNTDGKAFERKAYRPRLPVLLATFRSNYSGSVP